MITHDLATGFTLALDHRALIQGALKRGAHRLRANHL